MDEQDSSRMSYPDTPGYVQGSATSEAAARRVGAVPLRSQVEACIRSAPDGRTDDEIEVLLGMAHQTASPRRRELELRGRILGTGRKRKTRSGNPAQVYVHIDNAPPDLVSEHRLGRVTLTAEQREILIRLADVLAEARLVPGLKAAALSCQKSVANLLKRADGRWLKPHEVIVWPAA
jgi:hypothetical protein